MDEKADKRLERAADFLEWAIRWFFHMFATKDHRERWDSYSQWRSYLKSFRSWKTDESEGYFVDPIFPGRTVEGIDWLCNSWFGFSLTEREKGQLWEMIASRRKTKNFPAQYYINGEHVTPRSFRHWAPKYIRKRL